MDRRSFLTALVVGSTATAFAAASAKATVLGLHEPESAGAEPKLQPVAENQTAPEQHAAKQQQSADADEFSSQYWRRRRRYYRRYYYRPRRRYWRRRYYY